MGLLQRFCEGHRLEQGSQQNKQECRPDGPNEKTERPGKRVDSDGTEIRCDDGKEDELGGRPAKGLLIPPKRPIMATTAGIARAVRSPRPATAEPAKTAALEAIMA
jgi:hypothetical protein